MKKLPNPRWMKAIEAYVHSPDMHLTKLALATDIPYDTINRWFKDKVFLEALYKRHLEVSSVDLIHVYKAMVEEGRAGNVRAADFVYKVHGKTEQRFEGMESPYNLFLQINQMGDKIEKTEVVQNPIEDLQEVYVIPEPPKKKKVHMTPQAEKERVEVIKKTYKKQIINKDKRNALLRLKRRSKKVGLESMGNGRPSKTERAKWMSKLEELEKEKGIKPPSP